MANINLGGQSPQLSTLKQADRTKNKKNAPPAQSSLKAPLPQDTTKDWANNIFQGGAEQYDNAQKQSKDTGDNNLPEGNQFAVQYTGKGNNTGTADHLTQITDEGNNTGTTKDGLQFTQNGDNTASATDEESNITQLTLQGNNKTDGDIPFGLALQATGKGNNSATGKTAVQYTGAGDNNATGTGEGSQIMQNTDDGNNTATNASYINQQSNNGKNIAIGTDGNDEIIESGDSTVNAGAGDDRVTIKQNEKESKTYNIDGGDGFDKLNLYGNEDDWSKEVKDGTVTYKNKTTGDTVIAKNLEDAEYGVEPPDGQEPSSGPDDGGNGGDSGSGGDGGNTPTAGGGRRPHGGGHQPSPPGAGCPNNPPKPLELINPIDDPPIITETAPQFGKPLELINPIDKPPILTESTYQFDTPSVTPFNDGILTGRVIPGSGHHKHTETDEDTTIDPDGTIHIHKHTTTDEDWGDDPYNGMLQI
jgi:hypothetical protein